MSNTSRAAVKPLMEARFNSGKHEVNKMIRALSARGTIEEIPSKGTPAFRVTEQAADIVSRPKRGQQTRSETEGLKAG